MGGDIPLGEDALLGIAVQESSFSLGGRSRRILGGPGTQTNLALSKVVRALIVVIVVLLQTSAICLAKTAKDITVVFRYDDPSARSNNDLERRLIELFGSRKMNCSFAVIPCVCSVDVHEVAPRDHLPLPKEKCEMLARAAREGILEIAQHGYSHQTNGLVDRGASFSEFAHLDYQTQFQKIKKGRHLLESRLGIEITTFVPPWHSYDSKTLVVLEQQGYQCLSSAMNGIARASSSLRFVPATCGVSQLRKAIRQARDVPDPTPSIVVLFHPYDFVESGNPKGLLTFDLLAETLDWLSSQDDVTVRSMSAVQHSNAVRYSDNHRLRRIRHVLPDWLPVPANRHVYLSNEAVQRVTQTTIVTLVVFYGGLVLLVAIPSFGTGIFIQGRLLPAIARLMLILGYLIFVGGAIWVFHDGRFGAKGVMALAGVLGWCVGNSAAGFACHWRTHPWRAILGLDTKPWLSSRMR